MNRPIFAKPALLVGGFIFSLLTVALGLAIGFWLGQTTLGQWLPRLFGVGTGLAFTYALYISFNANRLAADMAIALSSYFYLFCLFLVTTILATSLSAIPTWQLSPSDRIAGFIPFSDAQAYYRQVLAWPDAHFDSWNSRRPLNAVINILEFHLGGSTLLGMQLVRVTLAALAISAFTAALSSMTGAAAALAAGFSLLIWTWPYASSMLSEINGISMSSASFALLLVGLHRKDTSYVALALLGMVLAYALRPYNPLMPALLAIFTAWGLWGRSTHALNRGLLLAMVAIVLVLGVPKLIYMMYGDPEGSPNANAAPTLLGLARGTDWKEASEFISKHQPGLNEKEASALMYQLASKTALNNPTDLLKALTVSSAKFAFTFQQQLGSVFGFPDAINTNAQGNLRIFLFAIIKNPFIWISTIFTVVSVALVISLMRAGVALSYPIAASLISLISFAPLLFTDGGWRAIATLLPGIAMLVTVIPLAVRHQKLGPTVTSPQYAKRIQKNGSHKIIDANYLFTIFIAIFLAVLTYPLLFGVVSNINSEHPEAASLTVHANNNSQWTGFNAAEISINDLQRWCEKTNKPALQSFLKRFGNEVTALDYKEGLYILRLKDGFHPSEIPLELKEESFSVRFSGVSGPH